MSFLMTELFTDCWPLLWINNFLKITFDVFWSLYFYIFVADCNGGYVSIDPANTTFESSRNSSEESLHEQGMNHRNATNTPLLREDMNEFSGHGYIAHESIHT